MSASPWLANLQNVPIRKRLATNQVIHLGKLAKLGVTSDLRNKFIVEVFSEGFPRQSACKSENLFAI